jgi:putative N6-adenine-specific DNA methylase
VLIELASFKAFTFEDLFQGVKALPLEDFIGVKDAFPVRGYALDSKLHSVPDCQKIIKKAAVERLKSRYNVSWFEETGCLYQLQFSIMKDLACIYLDTTGEGLHKRGYRRNSNLAPIKETLAAGIVDLARIRANSAVCDPFCGSGTFLIESAIKALNVPPGINRTFSAESWEIIGKGIWAHERISAKENIRRDADFKGIGYDIDADAVRITKENVLKAHLNCITADTADIADYKPEEGVITLCNPPYGERMLEVKQAEQLYVKMGEVLKPPCYIISPHNEFERFFGRKADKRRKLYNGMIKCNLYMYYNT